jgi:hypothetical protein
LVALAAIWAGFIAFVGPYFHFTLGPDHAWTWTSDRFWLDVLPAIALGVGGLVLLARHLRASGRIAALLALAGGAWLAAGPTISTLWHAGGAQGAAHGGTARQMFELLTMHTGVGVLAAVLATYALSGPRLAPAAVPAPATAKREPAAEEAAAEERPTRRRWLGLRRALTRRPSPARSRDPRDTRALKM